MALIEHILEELPADQRQLRVSFDRRDDGYVAWAMLTLPTANLIAQSDAPVADHRLAIDQVVNKLAVELRDHRRRMRGKGPDSRRQRRERDFAAAQSHLSHSHDTADRDAFFDILRPLLRQISSHARRELAIAHLDGTIPRGEVTVGDVLDEVLVRAWERWDRRPVDLPLDRWLIPLVHEVLEQAQTATPSLSLQERVREDDPQADPAEDERRDVNPEAPYAPENGWAVENNPYWPFVDALTRDDVLPAEDSTEPWQRLAADEERRTILDELSKLPRDQRRALALHALEGWTFDEIAHAQGRSAEEVRADVEAARHLLRERLTTIVNQGDG